MTDDEEEDGRHHLYLKAHWNLTDIQLSLNQTVEFRSYGSDLFGELTDLGAREICHGWLRLS